jgi:hypothetical protein
MDQTFSCGWSGGAAASVSARPTLTGDTAVQTEFTLAAGTVTDQQQQFGFDVADVEGLLIVVEDNDLATVTLETNATDATGGQTFTFPIGGGELYWTSRSPQACPLTLDVTTTYWTKTGADEPTVYVRVLLNS